MEKMITHIAAAVARSTPLPTVLLREKVSTEARDHAALPVFSAAFPIRPEKNFSTTGKRSARDVTAQRRHTVAKISFVRRKKVISAIRRNRIPVMVSALLKRYSVSRLSKMMSRIDVRRACRIARSGIRHSTSTAPSTTPIGRRNEMAGRSKATEPCSLSTENMERRRDSRIGRYRRVAGMLPRSA